MGVFYYTYAPLTPKKWVNCLIYYGRKPRQRRIPFIGENLLTFGIFLLYLSSFCSQKRTYSSHKLGKFFLCLIPYLKQICKGNEAHFMGARLINRERGEFIHISVSFLNWCQIVALFRRAKQSKPLARDGPWRGNFISISLL